MNKQKDLWEKLATENSKYYINSDKGKRITDVEFRDSGLKDYNKYLLGDPYIAAIPELSNSPVAVVDLGCGTGRMLEFMAADFDQVIGVDISSEMIRQARQRLSGIANIELIENDGETIPLKDNSVDLVFSYLVFQHIKDRRIVEKNFKEVFRILKPKGLFKVLIRSDKVDVNKWWGGVEYNEQSIGLLIKRVGFKLLKTEPRDKFGFWLWLSK